MNVKLDDGEERFETFLFILFSLLHVIVNISSSGATRRSFGSVVLCARKSILLFFLVALKKGRDVGPIASEAQSSVF